MVLKKLKALFMVMVLLVLAQWSSANVYRIKHKETGLVLTASDRYVRMKQQDDSSDLQKWTLQYLAPGQYLIRNVKEKEKALDVESRLQPSAKAIIYYVHKLDNQRFHINSDDTIAIRSKDDFSLQVALQYKPGDEFVTLEKYSHEEPNQKFELVTVKKIRK